MMFIHCYLLNERQAAAAAAECENSDIFNKSGDSIITIVFVYSQTSVKNATFI
jgi:hypothetical protein